MNPKPTHLSRQYAEFFDDRSVVAAYGFRPPYAPSAFLQVTLLAGERPQALDIGCGTGDIAFGLLSYTATIDAVDMSTRMIREARRKGAQSNAEINWIHSDFESFRTDRVYNLVIAGDSFHWLDWAVAIPKVDAFLADDGVFALVGRNWQKPPSVAKELSSLYATYSVARDYQPLDIVGELTSRGLFSVIGDESFGPVEWRPSIEAFVESHHSQRGFDRERMKGTAVKAFDEELRGLAKRISDNGVLPLSVITRVTWGQPLPSAV